ncbi:MAG: hypothetical protein H7263_04075 [Candidatus Sericytochromatia bacterium]|nr:hypothetical protein [Candidatus Sericytochromatia bacterium]
MASNRKKVEPTIYSDSGWGDSISVSKKAREELADVTSNDQSDPNKSLTESKNKTAKVKEYNYDTPKKYSPTPSKKKEYDEVNNQVEQLNHEINKAVGEIENVLEKFVSQLWIAINNFFLAIYNLFLKMILLVFVQPLKNTGKMTSSFLNLINDSLTDVNEWLSGSPKQRQVKIKKVTESLKYAASQSNNVEEPKVDKKVDLQRKYPAVFDGIVFSELSLKGIVFLNIKNILMYDLNKKEFTVEEEQELLDGAVKEINNCARLAKSLPSPTKGKYVDQPMVNILENANMSDLKMFLQYVYTHPKPFVERKLRLSEAFATWAHKGAPI